MAQLPVKPNVWTKINDVINNYKSVIVVGVAVFTTLVSWLGFGVPIFQPFYDIKYKFKENQREESYAEQKQLMVDHHILLGNTFLDLMKNNAAKIEFEKALKLDAFSSEAELGLFKAELNDSILNIQYDPEILLKRITYLKNNDTIHGHAYVYLGDIYSSIAQQKGQQYYDTALKTYKIPFSFFNQALLYYDSALTKNPRMASAHYGKGVIYDLANDIEKAKYHYGEALKISPWNRTFMCNLAYQHYKNKDYRNAIKYCDSIKLFDSWYIVSYYTKASSHLCLGELDDAVNCYNTIYNLYKDKSVLAQESNMGPWFFNIANKQPLYFYTYGTKMYYAYYSAALAYHIYGDEGIERAYIKLADDLKLENYQMQAINNLIIADADLISAAQPKYAKYCEGFKRSLKD
jgi:tetratricopeptide (TPR) repeat protein